MPTTLTQGEIMMQIIIMSQHPPSRRRTTLIRGQGRRIPFIAVISCHCAPVCPHPTVDYISGRSYPPRETHGRIFLEKNLGTQPSYFVTHLRLGINILLLLLLFIAHPLPPLLKFPKNAHNIDARGDYDANHHRATMSSF